MKIINNILLIGLVFGSIVSLSSCDKETIEDENINKTFVVEAAETGLTFLAEQAESQFIEFKANGKWKASVDAAWVQITPIEGDVDGNIEVKVVNNDASKPRTSSITIKDLETSLSQVVEIVQGSKNQNIVFSKESAMLKFGEKVLSDTLSVTANYDWDLTEVPEWLTYEILATKSNTTKTIVLHADVEKLTQYEMTQEVVFKDNKNVFDNVKFSVVYPGFESSISFKSGFGPDPTDVIDYKFDFQINSVNEIRAKLIVESNYQFEIKNNDESITQLIDINPEVTVVNGFKTQKHFFINFDNSKLDTEDITASFNIVATSLEDIEDIVLTAKVKGVGENYLFADFEKFKRDMDGSGYFRFEQGSRNPESWEKEGYISDTLKVVSSKPVIGPESEWPFAIFVADEWGGQPVKPTRYINWVFIDPIQGPNTKTTVSETYFNLEVDIRGGFGDRSPGAKRTFTVFVVERTSPDMTVEDLFDENGDVLPQYSSSYQLFMQDPKKIEYQFVVPEMPNFEKQISSDEKPFKFTIDVVDVDQEIPIGLWTNYNVIDGVLSGTPWYQSQDDHIVKNISMEYHYLNHVYKVTLEFKKNDTGKERIGYYGFSVFENEQEHPGFGFTITQSAAN